MQAVSPAAAAQRSLLPFLATLWMALLVFLIFLVVTAKFFDYFPADVYIAHRIQDIDVAGFSGFMDFMNALGSAWMFVPLTVGLAVLLAGRNAWLEAVLMIATFLPRYVNGWVKEAVDRPRPSSDLIDVTGSASGLGFPSGHTTGAAVLFGMLFLLMPALVPWRPLRWLLQAGCLLLVAAAGPARVYVGVHWPSDALGGYVLALLFLIPAFAALLALPSKR